MTSTYIGLIIGVITLLSSCGAEFQTYTISDTYASSLHYSGSKQAAGNGAEEDERKGVPAKSYYNGDLIGGAIWWARKGITIDKEEDFTVIAEGIGPDSIPFGATFPPLDFVTERVMLKVTARVESDNDVEPTLTLVAQDGGGFLANAKAPTITIKNTEDVEDYFFPMEEIFVQNSPVPHKVNGAFINSLQLYINIGGEPFTGKIFIDEIKIVPVKAEN